MNNIMSLKITNVTSLQFSVVSGLWKVYLLHTFQNKFHLFENAISQMHGRKIMHDFLIPDIIQIYSQHSEKDIVSLLFCWHSEKQ